MATWLVRDASAGEWLFAAQNEFRFGEFRSASGKSPTDSGDSQGEGAVTSEPSAAHAGE